MLIAAHVPQLGYHQADDFEFGLGVFLDDL